MFTPEEAVTSGYKLFLKISERSPTSIKKIKTNFIHSLLLLKHNINKKKKERLKVGFLECTLKTYYVLNKLKGGK